MNFFETVRARESVRNYDPNAHANFGNLETKIAVINRKIGPFGNRINVTLVKTDVDSSKMKLGTYGMIKGATNYLVVTCERTPYNLVDLGYLFEELILYATHLGLGTVWMAGTFSRKHFKEAIDFIDDLLMPIVSPIGVKLDSKRFLTSYIVKPKTAVRHEFGQLFVTADDQPLVYDETNPVHQALEMVRLAPSAMNKQPWRVIVDGDKYHFYMNKKGHEIDMGIALYHFDMAMYELGFEGDLRFEPNNHHPNYLTTWKPA